MSKGSNDHKSVNVFKNGFVTNVRHPSGKFVVIMITLPPFPLRIVIQES